MCGISGIIDPSESHTELRDSVTRMSSALTHRGPDGKGVWIDAAAGVALGHRRLAVVELSEAGRQPIVSTSGRWVITFNGEIYDHLSVRGRLPEIAWRGRSDSETLVAAVDAWGPKRAATDLEGMFAWAAWDRQERTLWLARDRFGEKPLYWSLTRGVALFGSELRALAAHPKMPRDIDDAALSAYLQLQYVPAPRSIFASVHKLPPGHLAAIQNGCAKVECYWSVTAAALEAASHPFRGTPRDAVDELSDRLAESVRIRSEADVPLGAMLSGGIDSSLIAAIMQRQAAQPVRTFAVGFDDPSFDESPHAAAVAAHLGTNHTTIRVNQFDALNLVPQVSETQDEPFGDSSIIPTLLLTKTVRQHVTVAMTGDGGDELFFGYKRYPRSARLLRIRGVTPSCVRRAVAWGLDRCVPITIGRHSAHKFQRGAAFLRAAGAGAAYQVLVTQSLDPGCDRTSPLGAFRSHSFDSPHCAPWQAVMAIDRATELHDDILTKVDRAAMAVALETRIPMLSPALLNLACSLPRTIHLHDGRGKWPLRALLERFVPKGLFDRPKRGFTAPVASWLLGPLRPWAEDLLATTNNCPELGEWGPQIHRTWGEFVNHQMPWQNRMWIALMYLGWRQGWRTQSGSQDRVTG